MSGYLYNIVLNQYIVVFCVWVLGIISKSKYRESNVAMSNRAKNVVIL